MGRVAQCEFPFFSECSNPARSAVCRGRSALDLGVLPNNRGTAIFLMPWSELVSFFAGCICSRCWSVDGFVGGDLAIPLPHILSAISNPGAVSVFHSTQSSIAPCRASSAGLGIRPNARFCCVRALYPRGLFVIAVRLLVVSENQTGIL